MIDPDLLDPDDEDIEGLEVGGDECVSVGEYEQLPPGNLTDNIRSAEEAVK